MKLTQQKYSRISKTFQVIAIAILFFVFFIGALFAHVDLIDFHSPEFERAEEKAIDRENEKSWERCNEGRGSERDYERAAEWEMDHMSYIKGVNEMIKALAKRIIVEPVDLEPKATGMILIVPHKKEQVTAIVISIGGEVDNSLEVGDIVYLPPDTGIEIDIQGNKFLSINENQILAAWKGQ